MGFVQVILSLALLGSQAARPVGELQQLAEEMLTALRVKDAERVLSYYEGGPDFVHVDNGRPVPWDQLQAGIRNFLSTVRVNDLRWQGPPRVLMLTDTVAVIHGWHTASGVGGDGMPLKPHTGYWSGTLRKSAAGWRIVHSHSSDTGGH